MKEYTKHTLWPAFQRLSKREPRLMDLLQATLKLDETPRPRCGNALWYGYNGHPGIKPKLRKLVGFEMTTRDAVLSTMHAYDVAYQFLVDLVPGCDGECACWDCSILDEHTTECF